MDANGTAASRTRRRRVVLASSVGTLLEYYDYYLFGLAAAVVFPDVFFPKSDPLTGQLQSLLTFAMGFLLRPIGAIVLSHVADRVGRKKALVITIMMMGIATLCIGLLPGYSAIGPAAPLLLVLFRLIQGFSTGGEMGGAVALAVEHAPNNRRGLYGAFLLAGAGVANLISAGLMSLAAVLPKQQFTDWGWRIPFLLSVLLLIAGLIIRLRVDETPEFEQLRAERKEVKSERLDSRFPLLAVLRRPKNLIYGILFGLANSIGGYVITTYGQSYIKKDLGLGASIGLTGTMVAAGAQIVLAPAFGLLSDRVGRRPVFIGGIVGLAVVIFPVFWLFNTKNSALIILGMVLGFSVFVMSMSAIAQTILSEIFDTEQRVTGVNMGYQLTAVIGGGFAPFVSAWLLAITGSYAGVGIYVIAACVLSLIGIVLLPERSGKELSPNRPITSEPTEPAAETSGT